MYTRVGVLEFLLVSLALATPVFAEDQPPVAPAAPVTVAPAVADAPAVSNAPATSTGTVITPDTEIFRRTPVIDGTVSEGEWDAFYTYSSGDWKLTAYADWDSSSIYVGAKSNKPVDLLAVLDANADGWFHGDENYEFKATRAEDGSLLLAVSRYDSRNTKSPIAAAVSAAEAASVLMRSATSGEWHMMEIRVPVSLVRGYKLGADKRIGLQIAAKTVPDGSGWVPTSQLGDIKECTLVTKKTATLKPLVVDFDMKDAVVARGEDLIGRFHLTNSGTETLDVHSFVIAGEGKSGEYLGSEKIRIEGLPPKKHLAHDIRTLVPSDMPVGCWALGAEVRNGETRMGAALVSFEVVDPFNAELRLPTGDVRADVKDVTFGVAIANNYRRSQGGKVKITLPVGWELWRNQDTRDFNASGNGVTSVSFKAKPPLGELGVVPVKVEVTNGRETKTLEGKITIVNP